MGFENFVGEMSKFVSYKVVLILDVDDDEFLLFKLELNFIVIIVEEKVGLFVDGNFNEKFYVL